MNIKNEVLIIGYTRTTQYTIYNTSIIFTPRIEFSIMMSAYYLLVYLSNSNLFKKRLRFYQYSQ